MGRQGESLIPPLYPQITPIDPARPSAGTKITSRQARQDRQEERTEGRGPREPQPLAVFTLFARDITPFPVGTYATGPELAGNVLQLLRVGSADCQLTTLSPRTLIRGGN